MKLSTYIKNLQKLEAKYGDLKVIYASDDEGNSFHLCHNTGAVGNFDKRENQFTDKSEADWYKEYNEVDSMPINAVCIN